MNYNTLNGVFYSPEDMTSMELSADIYIDRTSIEVFIDNGAYSYSMQRKPDAKNTEGFHFWGNNIDVKIWKCTQLNLFGIRLRTNYFNAHKIINNPLLLCGLFILRLYNTLIGS
ncbi:GH32 C-terminal domain-containing protein [Mucilaginibacter defluvii]|uniref:Glycosyl hydrolase family 32 n=1 Tax=Mucilaginibacter defluvii TaxID=1196019 RepID=A0ABP9FNT8_9SPHI